MSVEVELAAVTEPGWSDPPAMLEPESDPFAYTGHGYTGHGDHFIVETDYDAETVTVYGTAESTHPATHTTETDALVLQYAADAIGGEYQYGSPVNSLLNGELDSAGRVAGALTHDTDGLALSGPLAEDAPPLPDAAAGDGPQFSENPAYLESIAWNPHGDEGRSFAYCGEAIDATFTGMKSLHAHARRNHVPADPSVSIALKDDAVDGLDAYDAAFLDWVSANAAEHVSTAWLEDALHIEAPLGEE